MPVGSTAKMAVLLGVFEYAYSLVAQQNAMRSHPLIETSPSGRIHAD